jgi:MFS family permease
MVATMITMKKLLKQASFILPCLSLCALYFVTSGLNYWSTDYLITVLKADRNLAKSIFATVAVTGPIAGVITGGTLTTYFGGYKSLKALNLLVFETIFIPLFGLPIAFITNFYVFMAFIWFVMFVGGSTMPNLVGIMLSVVKDHEKTYALSIANFAYNLFGFVPAPFLYGLVYDFGEGNHARPAFFMLMAATVPFFILIVLEANILKKTNILGYT